MHSIFRFIAAAAVSTAAFAQQPASEQNHAAHHPEGASAPAHRAKAPVKPKAHAAKPKASDTAASPGMGMGADMGKMHDQAHEAGGMHDQMHMKGGKAKGSPMSAMQPASAASD